MKSHAAAALGLAALAAAQVPALGPIAAPPNPYGQHYGQQYYDPCPTGVIVVPTAIQYPVYISTYISANTVFNINGNANITINNAPTNLVVTTTATSTVFSTVTTTVTAGTGASSTSPVVSPTATTFNGPIILQINGFATTPGTKARRQNLNGRFLGSGGSVATGCQNASPLTLRNGQLFDQFGFQFSTQPGLVSNYFAGSGTVGSITTTFGLDGGFVWANSAFTGGAALFCVGTFDLSVRANFNGVQPLGCAGITFTAFSASVCPGLNPNSTTTSSQSSTATSSSVSGTGSSSSSVTGNATTSSTTGSVTSSSITGSVTITSSTISSNLSTTATSSSSTISVSSIVPVGSPTPVQLSFDLPAVAKAKRQNTKRFVTSQGTFTSDPAGAATFNLYGVNLFSGSSYFSANPGQANSIFVPQSPVGSIASTFSISAGPLTWTNETFTIQPNQQAQFCVVSTTVFVAFNSLPPGATVISLAASRVDSSSTSSSSSSSASASSSSSSSASTTVSSSSSSSTTSSMGTGTGGQVPTQAAQKRYNIPHERLRH